MTTMNNNKALNTNTNNNSTGVNNDTFRSACVSTSTSIDAAGDYRVTRQLDCSRNTAPAIEGRFHDLEISGARGAAPVATLNGQLLPGSCVTVDANGVAEIRNLKGILIDRVQLPINWDMSPAGQTTTNRFTDAARPAMGIRVRPVSSELAHHVAIDPRNTCVVDDVVAGSPAFVAGIEPDDVLLMINGKQASPFNLRDELATAENGRAIRLVVLCRGIKHETVVGLDANFTSVDALARMQYPGFRTTAAATCLPSTNQCTTPATTAARMTCLEAAISIL